jgi:hypothetical protein
VKSYGNDGSVESQEKQKALSLPFHTALGSSQKPRASHIPTASATTKNFPFSSNMFNFNFDESVTYMPGTFCYRYPRSHNKAKRGKCRKTSRISQISMYLPSLKM